MALMNKLNKNLRHIALGTAIITSPLAQGQNSSSSYPEHQSPAITQTDQTDFFTQYANMLFSNNPLQYKTFLIQHYQDIKEQIDQNYTSAEKHFQETGNLDYIYESALAKKTEFKQNIQDEYRQLMRQKENGGLSDIDSILLSAISGDAHQRLDTFFQKANSYPSDNPNINLPFYQMLSGIIKQIDRPLEQWDIHPEERLEKLQTLTEFAQLLSDRTETAVIDSWLKINPNRLHTFYKKTGNCIDATDGFFIRLNHPDKDQKLGFEFSVKQKDLDAVALTAQKAHEYIRNNNIIDDYETQRSLLQEIETVAKFPLSVMGFDDSLSKLKQNYPNAFQDTQLNSYLKRITKCPVQFNICQDGNKRPVAGKDADLFLDTIVESIYAFDKQGVINIKEVVSNTLGKESSLMRGLTSIGYTLINMFYDPIHAFLEEPVKEAFQKAVVFHHKQNSTIHSILKDHSDSKNTQTPNFKTDKKASESKQTFDLLTMKIKEKLR